MATPLKVIRAPVDGTISEEDAVTFVTGNNSKRVLPKTSAVLDEKEMLMLPVTPATDIHSEVAELTGVACTVTRPPWPSK